MVETLRAVKSGFELAQSHGSSTIVAAATMAARIASNTSEFLDRASAQGTPIQVLSGEAEAELGFRAVVGDPAYAGESRLSIVDVGGHSTELVTAERVGTAWRTTFQRSFGIGALGLREGPLKPDVCRAPELLAATELVDDVLGLRYLPHRAGQAVTLGATGTNLVSMQKKLMTWDPMTVHGAWLDYEVVSKSAATLAEKGDAQRAEVAGIEPGREHTIHAGALILERFLYAIGVLGCSVSTRGWRHAMIESDI